MFMQMIEGTWNKTYVFYFLDYTIGSSPPQDFMSSYSFSNALRGFNLDLKFVFFFSLKAVGDGNSDITPMQN